MLQYIKKFIIDSKTEVKALRNIWFPLFLYQTLIRGAIIIIFSFSYYFLVFWILKDPLQERVFITGLGSLNYIHIDRLVIAILFGILLFLFSFFIETFGVMSLSRQYYLGKKVKIFRTFLDIIKYFNVNFKVQILKYLFIIFNIVFVSFICFIIYKIIPNIFGCILAGIIIFKNSYIVVKKIIEYKDIGQKVFENKKNIFEIYTCDMDKKRKLKILKFYIFKVCLVLIVIVCLPIFWLYISKIIAKTSLDNQILTSFLLGLNSSIAIIIATFLSYLYISFFTLRATRIYFEYTKQKAKKLHKYREKSLIGYKQFLVVIIFIVFTFFQSVFYYFYFEFYVLEEKKITVFAHRASTIGKTNNSLEALQYCINNKIQYVEIDVQLSKDGIPIVFHDFTYFDGKQKKYVNNTSLAELKQFDLKEKGNTTKPSIQIPTLEEFLRQAKGKIKVNIELKTTKNFEKALVQNTAAVIKRVGIQQEVMITSFDYKALQHIKKLLPQVKTGLILVAYIGDLEDISNIDVDWFMVNNYYYFLYKGYFDSTDKKIGLWSFSSSFDGLDSFYENISGVIIDNPVEFQKQMKKYNNLSIGEKYYRHIEYIFINRFL